MSTVDTSNKWSLSTGFAFWGSVIQTSFNMIGLTLVLYLAYNLVDILMSGILPSVASMSLDYYEDRFVGFIGGATICFAIAFLGYLLYMVGICLFTGAQRSENSKIKTRNIMLAELIGPALIILFYVGYYASPEILVLILEHYVATLIAVCALLLAAVIIPMVGFKTLSKEESWSEAALKGADDLKFSYSCILWNLVVIILALGLSALVVYSSYTKLKYGSFAGIDKFGNTVQGITSIAQEFQNLVAAIKVIFFIASVLVFIFALLQTIYRILGWNKIKNGGNEEVNEFRSRIVAQPAGSAQNGFCHKCGMQLPDGAVFCPGCGTSVAAVAKVEPTAADAIEPEEMSQSEQQSADITVDYKDEESDNKKKWMMWGGIAAGFLVVAAAIWALWGRGERFEPNAKVFVIDTAVYETISEGNKGENSLAELDFGTAVQTIVDEIDDEKVDDIWVEVKFVENGKTVRGYINKYNIMNLEDFSNLEAAGFDDEKLRSQLHERLQRLAIAHAAKILGSEWSVEVMDDVDTYANAKNVFISHALPSENCFAFAMKKKSGIDDRKVFVYSMPINYEVGNIGQPVYLYDEIISIDKGAIRDVAFNKRKQRYDVGYLMRNGYSGEEEEIVEHVEEYPAMYMGPTVLHGKIDGKYDISMTLYESNDCTVTGSYRYVKNDIPIDLTGKFTNDDAVSQRLEQDLVIDEYVEGKNTGAFIGRFNGSSFSGKWVNADGSKEMPFYLER